MIFFSYDASMDATQVEAINALLETNKDIYVVSLKRSNGSIIIQKSKELYVLI